MKKSFSSMVRRPWLIGTRIGGGGLMAPASSITPPRLAEILSLIGIRATHGRETSGKVTFPVTIDFIGLNFRIHFGLERKMHSCGPFRTEWWLLTNGELALRRSPSPNNALFASLIRVNPLNVRFGTASKLEGHGVGPRSSCTNFAGFGLVTMIVSTRNKPCLGEDF